MKKIIFGIISAFVISLFFALSFTNSIKEARAETQYKKTPVDLNRDCYDTGGNCLDEVIITPDPDED